MHTHVNMLDSATLLGLPRRHLETNEGKQADFTQSDKRPEHVAAVTF